MKKNMALWWADVISILAQAFTLLLCLICIVIFIHLQFDKGFYNHLIIRINGSGFYLPFVSFTTTSHSSSGSYLLNELTQRSQILLISFTVVSLLLNFLILVQIRKFLRSIRAMKTFYRDNIAAFRKIGFIFLILFAIKIFPLEISAYEPDGRVISTTTYYSVEFVFFILSVFSFILSEVFREGEKIRSENEYTI